MKLKPFVMLLALSLAVASGCKSTGSESSNQDAVVKNQGAVGHILCKLGEFDPRNVDDFSWINEGERAGRAKCIAMGNDTKAYNDMDKDKVMVFNNLNPVNLLVKVNNQHVSHNVHAYHYRIAKGPFAGIDTVFLMGNFNGSWKCLSSRHGSALEFEMDPHGGATRCAAYEISTVANGSVIGLADLSTVNIRIPMNRGCSARQNGDFNCANESCNLRPYPSLETQVIASIPRGFNTSDYITSYCGFAPNQNQQNKPGWWRMINFQGTVGWVFDFDVDLGVGEKYEGDSCATRDFCTDRKGNQLPAPAAATQIPSAYYCRDNGTIQACVNGCVSHPVGTSDFCY